jgi:hypothetical protein
MYLLLLVFGALLTAAGIVLAASGMPIHDRAFDVTIVTPGIVAAVGGLALIGLGLALRVLQRIEQALAARPMPRVSRPGELGEPDAAPERPTEPARIPLPPKTASRPHTGSIAVAPPATADEKQPEDLPEKLPGKLPEKIPALGRSEATRIVDEMDLSLAATAPSADETASEVAGARSLRRRNGATATSIAPRLDVGARSSLASERPKGPAFDSLWPRGPRPMRSARQAATAQAVAAPLVVAPVPATPVIEPEQNSDPAPEAPELVAQQEATVSVLKSGVVDGMAYTLYSDGSIEAELPQGTLRFGSITELRNHIEQSA